MNTSKNTNRRRPENWKKFFRDRRPRLLFCLILIAASCILGGAAAVYRHSKDTAAPVITCPQEEIGYIPGEDTAVLLQDVTAADPEDGDVTASVRVRSISIASDQNIAIVTYAARDQANNIGTAKRYVRVKKAGQETETARPDGGSTAAGTADGPAESPEE